MPENFAAVGALYEPASGAADVDDLFCLVAVWTFELDVFRSDRHLRFFHQARFFTSLRSLSVRFNYPPANARVAVCLVPACLAAVSDPVLSAFALVERRQHSH